MPSHHLPKLRPCHSDFTRTKINICLECLRSYVLVKCELMANYKFQIYFEAITTDLTKLQ
jgi:hypothetical protein